MILSLILLSIFLAKMNDTYDGSAYKSLSTEELKIITEQKRKEGIATTCIFAKFWRRSINIYAR